MGRGVPIVFNAIFTKQNAGDREGSGGRIPYDAGEGALSRRERSGDAMGEGAPSMSLGSSPATPNGTAQNPTSYRSRT